MIKALLCILGYCKHGETIPHLEPNPSKEKNTSPETTDLPEWMVVLHRDGTGKKFNSQTYQDLRDLEKKTSTERVYATQTIDILLQEEKEPDIKISPSCKTYQGSFTPLEQFRPRTRTPKLTWIRPECQCFIVDVLYVSSVRNIQDKIY